MSVHCSRPVGWWIPSVLVGRSIRHGRRCVRSSSRSRGDVSSMRRVSRHPTSVCRAVADPVSRGKHVAVGWGHRRAARILLADVGVWERLVGRRGARLPARHHGLVDGSARNAVVMPRSFQEIEVAFRSKQPRRGCALIENAVEPLSGKSAVRIGKFGESDRHEAVDQGHQRGVEVRRIAWTKERPSSPVLMLVGPTSKPVHTGNYLSSVSRCRSKHSPAWTLVSR